MAIAGTCSAVLRPPRATGSILRSGYSSDAHLRFANRPVPDSPAVTTILFTDIEGSSRLWEREPARMAAALAGHNRLLGAAVTSEGGASDHDCCMRVSHRCLPKDAGAPTMPHCRQTRPYAQPPYGPSRARTANVASQCAPM